MIDRSFGNFAQALRSPDLRLGDVRTRILRATPPLEHRIESPDRSIFIYALNGRFSLEIEGAGRGAIMVTKGSAAGIEDGRAHVWRAPSAAAAGIAPGEELLLFISSIPRRMGVLQQLPDGLILIPADAQPFATILRHSVATHVCELDNPMPDGGDAVIRRCAEICMIQFVRYARFKAAEQPHVPAGLAHDEHLLRAWGAFFAEPRRRWTLQTLANAAGLGRTVFATRFRKVFGAPVLQTLTALRLEQAEAMLRETRAPLIEIAFTVGYASEAAFVRAFHRQYGQPPGRFRAAQAANVK